MSTFLDKLDLRPQERRLVVIASAILFLVLQVWLVWPHFNDWNQIKASLDRTRGTLRTYAGEIARTNEYTAALARLEGQGTAVLDEEQGRANILIAQVQAQAIRSRVNTSKIVPVPRGPLQTRTNLFFEEQWIDVGVNPTGDEEIVDFLIAIGSGNLVVRVKELELKPDIPSHSKLAGSMKLVASFQKKSPSRTPVAAAARR